MLKNIKNNWQSLIGYYNTQNGSASLTKELISTYNLQRPNGPQRKLCYAPFRNIYFGYGGKASSCCYGRDYILGEFPKQTIKEIWQGRQVQELREAISNNNLDKGCKGCLSQLLAKNFDAVKANQYDDYKVLNHQYPSVLELELSNTCNLECEMCSGVHSSLIRQNREHLPPLKQYYDDSFVEQLEEFLPYLEEIKFYGGEPFLIDIYYKIWDKVIEINPDIRLSVQTNGTILNNRVKTMLSKSNFHINLSIDSLQKETYNAIRVNANFDRVMENLKWFYDYCKQKNTYFGISMCAMKNNWQEVIDFMEFATSMQFPLTIHTVTTPKEMAIRNMSLNDIKDILDTYNNYQPKENSVIDKQNSAHYHDFTNQIERWLVLKSKLVVNQQLREAINIDDFNDVLAKEIRLSKKIPEEIKAEAIDKMHALFSDQNDLNNFKKVVDFEAEFLIDEILNRILNYSLEDLKSQLKALA